MEFAAGVSIGILFRARFGNFGFQISGHSRTYEFSRKNTRSGRIRQRANQLSIDTGFARLSNVNLQSTDVYSVRARACVYENTLEFAIRFSRPFYTFEINENVSTAYKKTYARRHPNGYYEFLPFDVVRSVGTTNTKRARIRRVLRGRKIERFKGDTISERA